MNCRELIFRDSVVCEIPSDRSPRALNISELTTNKIIPTIDPYELLGFAFVKEHSGKKMKATVKEIIDDNVFIEYGNNDY